MSIVARVCLTFIWILVATKPLLLSAEIYKYKDEKGRWQYTDKKPLGNKKVIVDQTLGSASASPVLDPDKSSWVNLNDQLTQMYNPSSSMQAATLSVIKIETILGVGSGFFVSDSGHIITNKHVVRPQASTSWKETERELKEQENEYRERFRSLKLEKERVKLMREDLLGYQHQIKYPQKYYNPISKERYAYFKRKYNKAKRDYEK